MNVETLLSILDTNPDVGVKIQLPDGSFVPAHFHVTEVGHVQKTFIDCGGVVRSTAACVIQVWVANDVNHRVNTTKLSRIFHLAAPILKEKGLSVEIEFERDVVSQFPLVSVDAATDSVTFQLGSKHTACLAPQLCVVGDSASCCDTANCC